VAISPLVALFNHSCVPNAVVVFPNGGMANDQRGMEVIALRDLEQGEEVRTRLDHDRPIGSCSDLTTNHNRSLLLTSMWHLHIISDIKNYSRRIISTVHVLRVSGRKRERSCLNGHYVIPLAVRRLEYQVQPGKFRIDGITLIIEVPIDMNTIGPVSVKCEPCGVSYQVDMNRFKSLVEFAEQLLQEDAHGLLGERLLVISPYSLFLTVFRLGDRYRRIPRFQDPIYNGRTFRIPPTFVVPVPTTLTITELAIVPTYPNSAGPASSGDGRQPVRCGRSSSSGLERHEGRLP